VKRSVIIIIILLLSTIQAFGKSSENEDGLLPETTDLHFTGKYCDECHLKKPIRGTDPLLKFNGDFTQLCRCHGYTPGTYIHPVDIKPSEDKKDKIPDHLPLRGGKITCTTCHEIYLQCQYSPEMKDLNSKFMRGAPYVRRTDLCFQCHDEEKYKMLDPHNQLDANGKIIVEKCLYCHTEKPDENTATISEIKLIGQFEVICFRCHYKQSKLHPINADHLRKPNPNTLKNLQEAEEKFGVIFPLNNEGSVTCPTCHNPHERGIIPPDKPSSQGASEKYRLRLAAKNLQICIACHKDKFKDTEMGQ